VNPGVAVAVAVMSVPFTVSAVKETTDACVGPQLTLRPRKVTGTRSRRVNSPEPMAAVAPVGPAVTARSLVRVVFSLSTSPVASSCDDAPAPVVHETEGFGAWRVSSSMSMISTPDALYVAAVAAAAGAAGSSVAGSRAAAVAAAATAAAAKRAAGRRRRVREVISPSFRSS
jgi:hypothetical protein